jgi:hypothetical protein
LIAFAYVSHAALFESGGIGSPATTPVKRSPSAEIAVGSIVTEPPTIFLATLPARPSKSFTKATLPVPPTAIMNPSTPERGICVMKPE